MLLTTWQDSTLHSGMTSWHSCPSNNYHIETCKFPKVIKGTNIKTSKVKIALISGKYSQHPKTRHLRFSNCRFVLGCRMVRYSILIKRSRLILTIQKPNKFVRFWNAKWWPKHKKTGPKKCPKNYHLKTGWSGIRSLTVHIWLSQQNGRKIMMGYIEITFIWL
jgi:hypothetical protein